MSLLEALLLDPVRVDTWVAIRAAGTGAGSGTQMDPYDGSTATKFDALMRNMAANACVHLGLGPVDAGRAWDHSIGAGAALAGSTRRSDGVFHREVQTPKRA